MSDTAILGIDLGTSSVRTLLATPDGRILGKGQASYPTLHPDPIHDEQRPDDWWQAMAGAVTSARRFAPDANVAAIGVTGQMHGTVTLDADRQPLGPAIIWSDRRTSDLVDPAHASLGADLPMRIGGPLAPGYQGLTLAWLHQRHPAHTARMTSALLPVDYLMYLLTGELATVPSLAATTGLYDLTTQDWSPGILTALELERDWLPPFRAEGECIGPLTTDAASHLELSPGIPIYHGGGDAMAAVVATGVVTQASAMTMIGHRVRVMRPAASLTPDPAGRWHHWPAAIPPGTPGDAWVQVGTLLNGGRAIEWIHRTLAPGVPIADLMDLARAAPTGSGGLLFLPYLAAEGLRQSDPEAGGAFLGLSDQHEPQHLVRAVIEGIAFSVGDRLSRMTTNQPAPERVIVGGSAARSFVRQTLASVLGTTLEVVPVQESAALGAARIAAHGLGMQSISPDTHWGVGQAATVPPIPHDHAVYTDRLHLFREATSTVLPIIQGLQQP